MRLTGKSIYRLSRLAFALCFCLLFRIGDAAPVTNVDFVVISGRQDIDTVDPEPWQTKYNSYPVGRLLFWTVIFDDTQTRGEIYRSESGHIGFIKQVNGGEVFVIANESGGPSSWLLDTSTIHVDYSSKTYFSRPPHVWNKPYFDIFATTGVGNRGSLWNSSGGVISANYTLLGFVGNTGFAWRNFNFQGLTFSGVCPLVRFDPYDNGNFVNQVQTPFSYYAAYSTWRSPLFDVSLDFFKMMLDSKWWIRGQFAFNSTGITGIGYGTGEQGVSGQTASGSAGGAFGAGGITQLPGAIDDPPQTPLGLNGKWVYDPETKLWNWIGDVADNADQINPYDNSVMPENEERGLAQEATLRQVKEGVEGLAKESTLQQIRVTLEDFQQDQGITPEQLQVMIDNSVVSIVDGQVQYWEGKHLAEKLDAIDSSVDDAANRLYNVGNSINSKVDLITQNSGSIRDNTQSAAANTGVRGPIVTTLNSVGNKIVNAVNDINIPENPTVDGQDTEEYQIGEPDLSNQIDGWFSYDWPHITIPRANHFYDYDIGLFGWTIPFSYFNDDEYLVCNSTINIVRNLLLWLVRVSAVVGVFKAMGGGAS